MFGGSPSSSPFASAFGAAGAGNQFGGGSNPFAAATHQPSGSCPFGAEGAGPVSPGSGASPRIQWGASSQPALAESPVEASTKPRSWGVRRESFDKGDRRDPWQDGQDPWQGYQRPRQGEDQQWKSGWSQREDNPQRKWHNRDSGQWNADSAWGGDDRSKPAQRWSNEGDRWNEQGPGISRKQSWQQFPEPDSGASKRWPGQGWQSSGGDDASGNEEILPQRARPKRGRLEAWPEDSTPEHFASSPLEATKGKGCKGKGKWKGKGWNACAATAVQPQFEHKTWVRQNLQSEPSSQTQIPSAISSSVVLEVDPVGDVDDGPASDEEGEEAEGVWDDEEECGEESESESSEDEEEIESPDKAETPATSMIPKLGNTNEIKRMEKTCLTSNAPPVSQFVPVPPKQATSVYRSPPTRAQSLAAMKARVLRAWMGNPPIENAPADGEDVHNDDVPMKGTLTTMCCEKEVGDRTIWRQLDIFEMITGSTIENPVANPVLAVKKYQRSSADKAYHAKDTRTLEYCSKAIVHLMTNILMTDLQPYPALCELCVDVDYMKVYSFLRDRSRAVRVDLHVQQPWSTVTKTYIAVHEVCLRFEILSMYLLSQESLVDKFDQRLAHRACAQVMEPLLNAYQVARDKISNGHEAYASPSEPYLRRYAILLILVGGGAKAVFEHLPALPVEMLRHPAIAWATSVATAIGVKDYSCFIRLYKEADFLSATILVPLLNMARQRLLWLMVRSSAPQRRDKMQLTDISRMLTFTLESVAEDFLTFHGLEVMELGTGKKIVQLPSRNHKDLAWDIQAGAAQQDAFNERLGTPRMPEKCEFPRQLEGSLHQKYQAQPFDRVDLIFGAADHLQVTPQDKAPLNTINSQEGARQASAPTVIPEVSSTPAVKPVDFCSPTIPLSSRAASVDSRFATKSPGTAPTTDQAAAIVCSSDDGEKDITSTKLVPKTSGFQLQPLGTPGQSIFGSAAKMSDPRGVSREETPLLQTPLLQNQTPPFTASGIFKTPEKPTSQGVQRVASAPPVRDGFLFRAAPVASRRSRPREGGGPATADVASKASLDAGTAAVDASTEQNATAVPGTTVPVGFCGLPTGPVTDTVQSRPRSPAWSRGTRSPAPFTPTTRKDAVKPVVRQAPGWKHAPTPVRREPNVDIQPSSAAESKTLLGSSWIQLNRFFTAWRKTCQRQRRWTEWSSLQNRPEDPPVKRRQLTSETNDHGFLLGTAVPPPKLGKFGTTFADSLQASAHATGPSVLSEAMRRESLRLSPKSRADFHVHRIVLSQPPPCTSAFAEAERQVNAFGHALASDLGPETGHPENIPLCNDSAGGVAWNCRLLQRTKVSNDAGSVGASILEMRSRPHAVEENGAGIHGVGPISALFHVPAAPIAAQIDAANGDVFFCEEANDWRSEASRALDMLRVLRPRLDPNTPAKSHMPEGLPCVAVLFAVAVQNRSTRDLSHSVASEVDSEVVQRVADSFLSGLQEAAIETNIDFDIASLRVEAFCVGVTHSRKDAATGFECLRKNLIEAVSWGLQFGGGPCILPVQSDLDLPSRVVAHWAQNSLFSFGGLAFPQGRAKVRKDFDSAVDACVADLSQLYDSMLEELPEWSESRGGATGSAARQKVLDTQGLLWSLKPPVDSWCEARCPQEFWESVRQFLHNSPIRGATAPCHSRWQENAPTWDPAALRAVVPTQPRVSCGPLMLPPRPLKRAGATLKEGPTKRPQRKVEKNEADDGSAISGCSKNTVVDIFDSESEASRRQNPLLDLLTKDAAWADCLLRGVALLAARTPSSLTI